MTYEETLQKAAAEGAIRVYRLSDTTAYVYRLKDNQYQARTLTATDGNWEFTQTVVGRGLGRSADGWYGVLGMTRQAQPITGDAAKKNAGYSQVSLRQCYTCKQFKPEVEFERAANGGGDPHRNWECNECYNRRQRETAAYKKSSRRKGDFLDRETLASPPPPQGKI